MIENQENGANILPAVNEVLRKKMLKLVVFLIIAIASSRFAMNFFTTDAPEDSLEIKKETNTNYSISGNDQNATNIATTVARNVKKQPSCLKSYMLVILREICIELKLNNQFCKPENFYVKSNQIKPRNFRRKQPNNESKVQVPMLMNYVVGGLLVTSLAAALVEFYKAKREEAPKKNGKCPLSRKSSLADLTVLKHQRKELIRRESLMEVLEEGPATKQMGWIAPPFQRRCSLSTTSTSRSSHEFSLDPKQLEAVAPLSHITTVDRRMSVGDGRRLSILEDRRTSIDSRRTLTERKRHSVDDSPERRYHRLVHRH